VRGWSTAEVARASGVPVSLLRDWERRGLVVPAVADDDGYRAYGREPSSGSSGDRAADCRCRRR
jgi:hypothetical protein